MFIAASLLAAASCGTASANSQPSGDSALSTSTTPQTDQPITPASATGPTVQPISTVPTLAIASTDGSITVVRDGVDVGVYANARMATDGHTLVASKHAVDTTTVEWVDIRNGQTDGSVTVHGTFELAALDESGGWATVVSPPTARVGEDIAGGRSATELVVVAKPTTPTGLGAEIYRHTLTGNFEPEMLGSPYEGKPEQVFLLEYLPPDHPTSYRVRVLYTEQNDLALPQDLRDKSQTVDESMSGISRAQVAAPDRKLLLTLYRGRNVDGTLYAFIHALRYEGIPGGEWSGTYCLDLPAELQLQASPGAAAMSPDQTMMFIANGNGVVGSFRVADLDDRDRPPHLFATGQLSASTDHAPAIAATNESVWVGYGTTIVELNPTDLSERQRFSVDEAALALAATPTGLVAISASSLTQFDAHGVVLSRTDLSVSNPLRVTEVR